MGISGLLPLLKSITQKKHVSSYKGKKVAVDGYSWLHKGAYCCSRDLSEGVYTENFGVEPLIVFDGGPLPMKGDEERSRQRSREENRSKALAHLRAGNNMAAEECFQKAVDISPKMAKQLIEALKEQGVEYIVAPYEADAQLAYLAKQGDVWAILTEDSDLLTYGCTRVMYKLDKYGNGEEVVLADLPFNEPASFVGFTHNMFVAMCVMAGCDFLVNLSGIGIKKAHASIKKFKNWVQAVKSMRFSGTSIPRDYELRFQQAIWVFRHQRVYCPHGRKLVTLQPVPNGGLGAADVEYTAAVPQDEEAMELSFLGPMMSDEVALGIAAGELDPTTNEPFDLAAIYRGCARLPPLVAIALGLPPDANLSTREGSALSQSTGTGHHPAKGDSAGKGFGASRKRTASTEPPANKQENSILKFLMPKDGQATPFVPPRPASSQQQAAGGSGRKKLPPTTKLFALSKAPAKLRAGGEGKLGGPVPGGKSADDTAQVGSLIGGSTRPSAIQIGGSQPGSGENPFSKFKPRLGRTCELSNNLEGAASQVGPLAVATMHDDVRPVVQDAHEDAQQAAPGARPGKVPDDLAVVEEAATDALEEAVGAAKKAVEEATKEALEAGPGCYQDCAPLMGGGLMPMMHILKPQEQQRADLGIVGSGTGREDQLADPYIVSSSTAGEGASCGQQDAAPIPMSEKGGGEGASCGQHGGEACLGSLESSQTAIQLPVGTKLLLDPHTRGNSQQQQQQLQHCLDPSKSGNSQEKQQQQQEEQQHQQDCLEPLSSGNSQQRQQARAGKASEAIATAASGSLSALAFLGFQCTSQASQGWLLNSQPESTSIGVASQGEKWVRQRPKGVGGGYDPVAETSLFLHDKASSKQTREGPDCSPGLGDDADDATSPTASQKAHQLNSRQRQNDPLTGAPGGSTLGTGSTGELPTAKPGMSADADPQPVGSCVEEADRAGSVCAQLASIPPRPRFQGLSRRRPPSGRKVEADEAVDGEERPAKISRFFPNVTKPPALASGRTREGRDFDCGSQNSLSNPQPATAVSLTSIHATAMDPTPGPGIKALESMEEDGSGDVNQKPRGRDDRRSETAQQQEGPLAQLGCEQDSEPGTSQGSPAPWIAGEHHSSAVRSDAIVQDNTSGNAEATPKLIPALKNQFLSFAAKPVKSGSQISRTGGSAKPVGSISEVCRTGGTAKPVGSVFEVCRTGGTAKPVGSVSEVCRTGGTAAAQLHSRASSTAAVPGCKDSISIVASRNDNASCADPGDGLKPRGQDAKCSGSAQHQEVSLVQLGCEQDSRPGTAQQHPATAQQYSDTTKQHPVATQHPVNAQEHLDTREQHPDTTEQHPDTAQLISEHHFHGGRFNGVASKVISDQNNDLLAHKASSAVGSEPLGAGKESNLGTSTPRPSVVESSALRVSHGGLESAVSETALLMESVASGAGKRMPMSLLDFAFKGGRCGVEASEADGLALKNGGGMKEGAKGVIARGRLRLGGTYFRLPPESGYAFGDVAADLNTATAIPSSAMTWNQQNQNKSATGGDSNWSSESLTPHNHALQPGSLAVSISIP
eukprot:gene14824-20878_t